MAETERDCTGAADCTSEVHIHGCFADLDGMSCDDPGDHDPQPQRAEEPLRDRVARAICPGRYTYLPNVWLERADAAIAIIQAEAPPSPECAAADEWRTAQNINHLRVTIRERWPALAAALNDWHDPEPAEGTTGWTPPTDPASDIVRRTPY